MVSKVKNEDNEKFPTWIIVVAVIVGVIILYGIFGSNNNSSNDYQTQPTTYQQPSTTTQQTQEPEDNRLSCPAGNQADSGQKTDDWFSCTDIKEMMNEKKSDEKIDCAKQENFNKEKVYFALNFKCEKGDYILFQDTKADCENNGGNWMPIIVTQSYPSLNEYYFSSISTEFKNLGCTKLNPDNYVLIYALYQDGKMLASKVDDKYISYINNLLGDEDSQIYPEAWLMPSLGFGAQTMLPTAVKTSSPNNFSFKVCLIDSAKKTIISCDETDFNIEYKSE